MLLPICFTTIYSFLENLEGIDILTTYEISPAAAEDLGYKLSGLYSSGLAFNFLLSDLMSLVANLNYFL